MFANGVRFGFNSGMNLPSLLVVDDDAEFLNSQARALESRFQVIPALGVHQSLEILKSRQVDCALVDYYLTDGNGHDIAQWMAENVPWCPVVLISAKVDKEMALQSFPHRIFDVVEKPYRLETVIEKLSSALDEFSLRRQAAETTKAWSFDKDRRTFRLDDTTVLLTQTEVRILEIMIESLGKVVTRESLIQALWGTVAVADNTLDTHLTNLRKKAPFFKSILRGVRGIGYILEL